MTNQTPDQQESSSEVLSGNRYHKVELVFDDGPGASLICEAPEHSWCHVHWQPGCDCEEILGDDCYVRADGVPCHHNHETRAEHPGEYTDYCELSDWFDNQDTWWSMTGTITVPVIPKWTGYGYDFRITTGDGDS